MPDVIGIRFKSCGKVYDFEINGTAEEIKKGDFVIVESDLGLSMGCVVIERHAVENPSKELKKVLRKATEEDVKQKQENEKFEKEARDYCQERIMARGLPMKLVFTEATLDKKRIIFYFTADGRIDFRELVKDLAAKFKTRIEMRQIGVRDEAKIVGGFGICGRELCCKTFLTSFEPISIKMAKQQDLVLNMSKLSGICGRLMCCLSYEISEDEVARETYPYPPVSAEPDAREEAKPVQAVVEDAPKPEVKREEVQHEPQLPPPQQPEAAAVSVPKAVEHIVSEKPAAAEGAEKPAVEQRNEHYGQRKRKRRRWRKFHQNGNPGNKPENK